MTYTLEEPAGTITVTDAALNQIVLQAAEAVDGARVRRARRKLSLELEGTRARVELELTVAYGKVLPDVARAVQEHVRDALAHSCGLETTAVDVSVEELDGR